jgi:hypothetical protein
VHRAVNGSCEKLCEPSVGEANSGVVVLLTIVSDLGVGPTERTWGMWIGRDLGDIVNTGMPWCPWGGAECGGTLRDAEERRDQLDKA